MNNFEQYYISKSISKGLGSFPNFITEMKRKEFLSTMFAVAQGLAAENEAEQTRVAQKEADQLRLRRQEASVRAMGVRGNVNAAKRKADAAETIAASKIKSDEEATKIARQSAAIKGVSERARSRHAGDVAQAGIAERNAKAAYYAAKAAEIEGNSDEIKSLRNAFEASKARIGELEKISSEAQKAVEAFKKLFAREGAPAAGAPAAGAPASGTSTRRVRTKGTPAAGTGAPAAGAPASGTSTRRVRTKGTPAADTGAPAGAPASGAPAAGDGLKPGDAARLAEVRKAREEAAGRPSVGKARRKNSGKTPEELADLAARKREGRSK